METGLDGFVNSIVQGLRPSTSKTHVGNRALVVRLSCSSDFGSSRDSLRLSLSGSPDNATNDIRHAAASVGSQDPDSNDFRLLGHAVLAGGNGASAVGTVAIGIFFSTIIVGNGLTPGRAAFKLHVVDVDTSIDDININAVTAIIIVEVLGKGAEGKPVAVADTSQTLNEAKLDAMSTM